MAACMARAIGSDNSRTKCVHRLGSQSAEGQANTWHTFATAYVNKDGSGHVQVVQNGFCIHHFAFGKEV